MSPLTIQIVQNIMNKPVRDKLNSRITKVLEMFAFNKYWKYLIKNWLQLQGEPIILKTPDVEVFLCKEKTVCCDQNAPRG